MWIIKRDGPWGYLGEKDPHAPYRKYQREALRFDKRWKAKRAAELWEACYSSSWRVRVVKLVPKKSKCMEAAEALLAQREWEALMKSVRENTAKFNAIADMLESLVRRK